MESGGELSAYDSLDKKAKKLDDFMKVVEDKHYIMGDLYSKYEQMEGFLKGAKLPEHLSPELELRL